MAEKQLMERAEQALYKVYNRFPVVFDHGEGVKLYDTEGNEYLDFGAGIAVMALGYGDEEYTKAVEEQLHKLTHISNLFYNQPSIEAGEKLLQVSHMDKVFFTNSGTEAIEGALKIAKRYHYNKLHETMGDGCDGCEDAEPDMTGEIIAMNHSFHGRSLGALSVTGNAVQVVMAQGGPVQAPKYIHQGRLSGPGVSHDSHKLPPFNGQVYLLKSQYLNGPGIIYLDQILQPNQGAVIDISLHPAVPV